MLFTTNSIRNVANLFKMTTRPLALLIRRRIYCMAAVAKLQERTANACYAHLETLKLKVKFKLANGLGSQYPSHYLGTWCTQHYYRRCAHLDYQKSTELMPLDRFKWTRPFRQKKKSGFCACAITFQLASTDVSFVMSVRPSICLHL